MVNEAGVSEAVVVSIGAGSCHSLAVVQLSGAFTSSASYMPMDSKDFVPLNASFSFHAVYCGYSGTRLIRCDLFDC